MNTFEQIAAMLVGGLFLYFIFTEATAIVQRHREQRLAKWTRLYDAAHTYTNKQWPEFEAALDYFNRKHHVDWTSRELQANTAQEIANKAFELTSARAHGPEDEDEEDEKRHPIAKIATALCVAICVSLLTSCAVGHFAKRHPAITGAVIGTTVVVAFRPWQVQRCYVEVAPGKYQYIGTPPCPAPTAQFARR